VGVTRIRVTIDELVLKGIEARDRNALVDGLRSELARVLADPATRAEWARTHRTPVLRLGQFPLESGPAGRRKLGKGMARAIGRGLKP
jgi:hypothetical protein